MGTWSIKIDGNDTFQDIYQNFFELYNEGQEPAEISKHLQTELDYVFKDYDDRNPSLFGLAFAQWETQSLDPNVFNKVKNIIETGSDLEQWKLEGVAEKTLLKRKKELEKFLLQISTPREKPKRRTKKKFIFETNSLVDIVAPDNLKRFTIKEEFGDKKYIHTGGLLMWEEGGGSVLYFTGLGKNISAKWIDSQTLEVTHDRDIDFDKKDDSSYYCGDDIKVIYIAK